MQRYRELEIGRPTFSVKYGIRIRLMDRQVCRPLFNSFTTNIFHTLSRFQSTFMHRGNACSQKVRECKENKINLLDFRKLYIKRLHKRDRRWLLHFLLFCRY